MAIPDTVRGSVVYLGIDNFSFQRGYRFGTILDDPVTKPSDDGFVTGSSSGNLSRVDARQPGDCRGESRSCQYLCKSRFGSRSSGHSSGSVCKNLTEATQLLLARSQAEILAVENKPRSDEPTKQQISIQEWRPPEPACVKKARLARRAGRYARYQQVVEFGQQGMTPKEIAGRLGLSDRTVQKWLAAETFPEARQRRKKSSSFVRSRARFYADGSQERRISACEREKCPICFSKQLLQLAHRNFPCR
jgi:transposase